MQTTLLIEEMAQSFHKEKTSGPVTYWSKYVLENKIGLKELLPLLHREHTVGMRFAWMIGTLCEMEPEVVRPVSKYLYENRDKVHFPNFDRTLAKVFYLVGVPPEIEGEAIDSLFRWMESPDIGISIRRFALLALIEVTKTYPELKEELKLILESQLDNSQPTYRKLALQVLGKLRV